MSVKNRPHPNPKPLASIEEVIHIHANIMAAKLPAPKYSSSSEALQASINLAKPLKRQEASPCPSLSLPAPSFSKNLLKNFFGNPIETKRITEILLQNGFTRVNNTSFFLQEEKIVQVNGKGELIILENDILNYHTEEAFAKGSAAFIKSLKSDGFTEIAPSLYYKEAPIYSKDIIETYHKNKSVPTKPKLFLVRENSLLQFKIADHEPTLRNEIRDDKFVFMGIQEVEIISHDLKSNSIKRDTRPVFVYHSSIAAGSSRLTMNGRRLRLEGIL